MMPRMLLVWELACVVLATHDDALDSALVSGWLCAIIKCPAIVADASRSGALRGLLS